MTQITIIGLFLIVVICLIGIYDYAYKMDIETISFKEALDLTDLPIITFNQNGKKYNFILDTGSNNSHINKELVDSGEVICAPNPHAKGTVCGMEGNYVEVFYHKIILSYNNKDFEFSFMVNDLSNVFNSIKKANGATIHGIIGNDFMVKYKYVLDFNKFIAYYKK